MKHMPEQGGCVRGIPDGWVPGDDDNPRLDDAVEARADEIMDDEAQALEPLMQDAIQMPAIRESVASIFRAIEASRSGRITANEAKNRAFTAASCLYDHVRDKALVAARKELQG